MAVAPSATVIPPGVGGRGEGLCDPMRLGSK